MSKRDQNFNNRKSTFKKNIYGTSKGKIREAILLRDLFEYIGDNTNLNILDVGGGQGQIAIKLAQAGHQVTLTDISEDMLAIAMEEASLKTVTNMRFICSPLQDLQEHLTNNRYDIVLCHAVFEWLEKPREAFSILNHFRDKNGAISFMFYNQIGQEMSNLVYGNFDYIKSGLKAKKVVKLNPQSSLHPDTVEEWIKQESLKVITKSGVRVFHDYMRDLSKWQSDAEGILEMELKYSRVAPFSELGRYIHLILEG